MKIFHFATGEWTYWRWEAYQFVLTSLDESVDQVPINKRNFEVLLKMMDKKPVGIACDFDVLC